ncbi:hypothetical protein [Sorangium sp. So ce1078]|uniref:hypothetical protein n=1 Tax=Sorangium sp. So ce1078 TaxID=3133329 RepID=UPI003F62766E
MATVNSNRQVGKYLDPEGARGWRALPDRRGKRGGRLAAIIAGSIDELEADQRIGGWRVMRRVASAPPARGRAAARRLWRRCSACVTAARCPPLSTRRSGRRPVCHRGARAVAGGRFALTSAL